tara:strand:- start:575 stop:1087 length:513 start_codon:yes stop_codon:yes gene_type:complete
MSFTPSEIALLFLETVQFLGQSFIDFTVIYNHGIYLHLIFINLFCLYYSYTNNYYITKKEKEMILEIINEKKETESDYSDTSSENESEEDDNELHERLQENLRNKVQNAKTVIVESIYELLLVNPELKNSEITKELGLQSNEHNGYISLILMKQSGLFARDPNTKLWRIE